MKSNSNIVITNFSIDKTTQELTSVEINGKSFSLEPTPTPTRVSKLYAWTNGDGENVAVSIYTITATPDTDDKVVVIFAESDVTFGINKKYLTYSASITSVGTGNITYNNKVYERNSERDITFIS